MARITTDSGPSAGANPEAVPKVRQMMTPFTKSWLHGAKRTWRYWLDRNASEAGGFNLDVILLLIATAIWYLIAYDLYPFRPTSRRMATAVGWLRRTSKST
jgi:hypothetical protein